MKQETSVLIIKGVCYIFIGFLTPLATGLGQWANDGSWPSKINWVVLLSGAGVGAATQLLSFLSSAYSTYKTAVKDDQILLSQQTKANIP